jgi:hypothetical protein
MAYELKEGQGSIFPNNYKEKPSQPDHKGTILLDGVLYEIAGWLKESANGNQFMSLSGKRKEAAGQQSYSTPSKSEPETDVPF